MYSIKKKISKPFPSILLLWKVPSYDDPIIELIIIKL